MQTRRLSMALASAVLVAACASPAAEPTQPAPQPDPGVVHVHALAPDPANVRGVYAATHTGLFRIESDGSAERVGQRYHDLMGFTVTGEGEFLASGHPDLRSKTLMVDGKPPLLGLVASPDAGVTWTSVSLLGEVDFHALEVIGDRIYGADSTGGRFMVSKNRAHWRTLSTPRLADVAVSPADPELLVGVSEAGTVRSRDGGRNWKRLPTPTLTLVDWADDGILWAATPNGDVLASKDGGDSFETRGRLPGPPEALLVQPSRLTVAVADVGLLVSVDGGRTWGVMYRTAGS